MSNTSKKGCACLGGAGGCCGIIVIIILVMIVSTIAGGVWVKNRTYVNQPKEINKLSRDICEYKLPDEYVPAFGMDYGFVRAAAFVKKADSGDQNAVTVVFLDTSLTNFADFFDESAERVVVSTGDGNEMTVKTIDFGSFTNGDTKISCQEKLIYIEENDTSVTVYKGTFPKDDRIVMAWYMAVGFTNAPADAKTIINSIRKP